jgi:NTP pyrophosphatase (non-canonical NTP hydrolase)
VSTEDLSLLLAKQGAGLSLAQGRVLIDVLAERVRQERKWGEQNHDPFVYGAILSEEVGEAAQAALKAGGEGGKTLADLRVELVQVAAVAVAFIECLDRGKWEWRRVALPPVDAEIAGRP